MKDMLLTYNELNRDLGYVQGMSDLLAPIYAVEQDDAVAFWGFVGFMQRMVIFLPQLGLLGKLIDAALGTKFPPRSIWHANPASDP